MRTLAYCFVFCVLSFEFLLGASYQQALAARDWSFPRDHGRHDGFRIEWWYFTGNLTDDSGRRFGYQLTFFRSLLSPDSPKRDSPWAASDLYFAHAAIADVQDKQFYFHDTLSRGRAGLADASDQTMDVTLKDWFAKLDKGIVHLKAATADFSMDLNCAAEKPILQGPGGLSQKGLAPGQASYYYSMPRMTTTGTITIKGKRYTLTGLTWFDHEFSSNLLSDNQTGWDWISLQLLDGRSLMVYRLRNKDGTDTRFGSLAAADGAVKYLTQNEIEPHSRRPASRSVRRRLPAALDRENRRHQSRQTV